MTMLRTVRASVLLLAGLAMCAGCGRKIKESGPGVVYQPGDVVARVNGNKMVWEQMDKRARNFLKDEVESRKLFIPPGGEEQALEFYRRKVLTLFVNKTVMVQEAKKLGIEVGVADRQKYVMETEAMLKERGLAASLEEFFQKAPLGEKETRHEFEDGILVDKFVQEVVRSKITITDADRDALVNEIGNLRQDARAKVEELRAQLLKGVDFATMLKQAASGADKRVFGGDLGEFPRGRLGDKLVEDHAFSQKVNEIGAYFEHPRGYMLIKVTGHTAAKPASRAAAAVPETVRASYVCVRMPPMLTGKDIERVIQNRKCDRGLLEKLQALRAKAKIETIYKNLAF